MRIARHFIELTSAYDGTETAEDFDADIVEAMACAIMDQMSMATHTDEQTTWNVAIASAYWMNS